MLFVALTVGLSLVFQMVLVFPIGLVLFEGAEWVRNWALFGLNAGISGVLADQILRRRFGAILVITQSPRLALIWVWLAFLLLLAVLGPDGLKDLLATILPHRDS